jgi:hypothetical protein
MNIQTTIEFYLNKARIPPELSRNDIAAIFAYHVASVPCHNEVRRRLTGITTRSY